MTAAISLQRPRGGATDVIGRAINNAIANWEPVLIATGEMLVLMAIVIVSVMLLIPPIIKAGQSGVWLSLTAILVIAAWVVGIAAAILLHGFVSGATIRTYVDGCRAAMPTAEVPKAPAAAYRVFAFSQWLAYGRTLWLRAASVHFIVVITAVVLVGVFALLAFAAAGSRAVGCLIVPFSLVVLVPAAIALWMWSQKAIVLAVAFPEVPLGTILSTAWSALWDLFAFHFAVALIAGIIGVALGIVPLVGSAAASCLTLSAFAAMTEPA